MSVVEIPKTLIAAIQFRKHTVYDDQVIELFKSVIRKFVIPARHLSLESFSFCNGLHDEQLELLHLFSNDLSHDCTHIRMRQMLSPDQDIGLHWKCLPE